MWHIEHPCFNFKLIRTSFSVITSTSCSPNEISKDFFFFFLCHCSVHDLKKIHCKFSKSNRHILVDKSSLTSNERFYWFYFHMQQNQDGKNHQWAYLDEHHLKAFLLTVCQGNSNHVHIVLAKLRINSSLSSDFLHYFSQLLFKMFLKSHPIFHNYLFFKCKLLTHCVKGECEETEANIIISNVFLVVLFYFLLFSSTKRFSRLVGGVHFLRSVVID